MEIRNNLPTLQRIEALLKSNAYIIRYEKGHFNSGFCVLKEKKVIVVNKFFDTEARINCMIDILTQIDFDPGLIQDEKLFKFYQQLIQKK